MEIGIRLHDTAGSNLEEHLRNAKEQGFSCVHIAMSKVVPGFKMADAPELLTDALADEVRGLLEKYNQRCVLLGCYLNLCSPDLSAHERTLMNYRAHLRFGKKIGALMVGTETGAPNIGYKSCPECRTEESLRLFIERVKPVVRWAEEEGMIFAIEPVTRHIVCTAERCQRVLAEVQSENLRVILDAVNLLDRENVHQAQEVVTDAIARLGDSAELLHIKDFLPDGTDECAWARQNIANVNMFDGLLSIAPGLGQMDYRPLIQLAKRSGYERDGSFSTSKGTHWQSFDAGLAAEAFCVAAHDAGLGTVILGIYDEGKVKAVLNLPETESVSALIPIGVPAESPAAPKRKDVSELLRIR